MTEARGPETSPLSADESELVPDTSLSAAESEFVLDTSLSAGSEFVPESSLSAGSEFICDNVCQPCMSEGKHAEAENYCKDCREHLCVRCTGSHKKLSALKYHVLVSSADALKQIKATFVAVIKNKFSFTDKSIQCISGLALVSVEKLVAADVSNNRLLLVDTTTTKTISELKANCQPIDVTVCRGEVAATFHEAKTIVFFKCDEGLVLVRKLRVNGRCRGIDCVDDKLYVVYGVEKKLEVMTVTGTVLQRFDTDDQGGELFKMPTFVTLNTANKIIYVTDWENGGLIVLGLDGKVIGRYKDNDNKVEFGQLVNDKTTGVMYLSDIKNNTIHLMSPLCEKVKTLLTSYDDLQNPWSVCYCGSMRRLYIGTKKGIKVYQIS